MDLTQIAANPDGTITLRLADAGNVNVHRTTIGPGAWSIDGTFEPADLSDLAPNARAICAILWTDAMIDTWKKAHPFVPAEPEAPAEPPTA